jgi:hypothetical protein
MTREGRHRIVTYSIAFGLACGLTAICYALCGTSLALFFGGFFILTPLLPAMLLSQSSPWDRIGISSCIVGGIVLIWFIAISRSDVVSFSQCCRCSGVLVAYAMMLGGLALILLRIRFTPLFANAAATIAALTWLTWPIWLVPNLPEARVDSIVNFLARFHPLFAINGVLANLGDWPHWTIAYRELTTLGQDIPYSLPTLIVPCCAVHGIAGVVLSLIYGFSGSFPFKRRGAIL